MPSRRQFIESTLLSTAGLPLMSATAAFGGSPERRTPRAFVDLLRPPDSLTIQSETGEFRLQLAAGGHWIGNDISLTTDVRRDALHVSLSAPKTAVRRLHLRWQADLSAIQLILGDAWERAYGDLEWRAWVPDRVMPWYAATFDGSRTHVYGVRTGARAFCSWQIDPHGVSLWADVRSGGVAVRLGERVLEVCEVVCRAGKPNESAFGALHGFCAQMSGSRRLPAQPVYGSNDWYWAYGNNSAQSVLVDAQRIAELSTSSANRPFTVIDDGWQPGRGREQTGAGTWDRGNDKFPDMPALATAIRRGGARPGIWIRPLLAPADAPTTWRLSRESKALDPTIPEVRQKVIDDVSRVREWGFELIKHDYTTYDIFGRWGFQMGAALTRDGWAFANGPTQTTAEVISDLYRAIREAAQESLLIGCNTVSHLSAGQFDICRIGDDTSGTEWFRTRKMGVNTLAFRGVQHGAFYLADPDCVGVTKDVPWSLNRQWLDLVARSGTALFVSLAPDALGAEQRRDLATALALAAAPQRLGEPLDWQHTVYPMRWRLTGTEHVYDWVGPDGAGLP